MSVGPFAVIGAGARVGPGTRIAPHAVVEGGAELGADCRVGTGATVHGCARLGDEVVLGPGSRVGSDGYGFTEDEEGRPVRVPHVGGCEIGDAVGLSGPAVSDRV
ncbi:MAG: UDP-3-O-(3-hydroxymyristoyl)glucosamine N-acyltransferase, partial [Gemmatimonadota bacterium]